VKRASFIGASALGVIALASVAWLGSSRAPQTPVSPVSSRLERPVPSAHAKQEAERDPRLKDGLAGMPPFDPQNVYAFTGAADLEPSVQDIPERVFVPDGRSNRVSVIDPKTFKVVSSFPVGAMPQHVVPSYDLKTLYVVNDVGSTITPIDAVTAKPGKSVKITDPYNLYFTPDGQFAIVVAEVKNRLDFYDPQSWTLEHSLSVPCRGINHMDYTADGRYLLAACEFSGDLLRIDVAARAVVDKLHVGGMPQDVKLAPDGKVFFVANMVTNGVHVIPASTDKLEELTFIPTGKGAHGLYPSRDAQSLYISNRAEGSVSVLEFSTRLLTAKWTIPGGGSPDMGSVSADGTQLWLTGRTNGEVYVFDTSTGKLEARIEVGKGPHGLTFFPQPGRYSLGHTGVYR
jgi:YVTN family beta-propeller protein